MYNPQLFLYREKKILSFLSLLDKELYCSLQLKQSTLKLFFQKQFLP